MIYTIKILWTAGHPESVQTAQRVWHALAHMRCHFLDSQGHPIQRMDPAAGIFQAALGTEPRPVDAQPGAPASADVTWSPLRPREIAEARQRWDYYKSAGFLFCDEDGKPLHEFDPRSAYFRAVNPSYPIEEETDDRPD